MPRDEEITFADHVGRFYAGRYGFPPMVGRVLGYLLVCDPRDQTIAELSEALLASRTAITNALDLLGRLDVIRRSRAAGQRMDRVRVDFSSAQSRGFDVSEYQQLGDLAREGLRWWARRSPEQRADLLEMAAFADFLAERTRTWQQDWEAAPRCPARLGRAAGIGECDANRAFVTRRSGGTHVRFIYCAGDHRSRRAQVL